jgi:hypothetical protein
MKGKEDHDDDDDDDDDDFSSFVRGIFCNSLLTEDEQKK